MEGWVPDKVAVTGTMKNTAEYSVTENGGITVDVYYTEVTGTLNIYYLDKETKEPIADPVLQTLTVNAQPVVVKSPTIPGYTPDQAEVSVDVSTKEKVEAGAVFYVYYTANTYDVQFVDQDEITFLAPQITVQYDKPYGYYRAANAESFAYGALPVPLKSGYKFLGWFTADGTQIKETDTVAITEDQTLYAKWEMITYKVTVRYIFPGGTTAGEVVTEQQALTNFEIADPETFAVNNGLTFDGKFPTDGFAYDPEKDISIKVDSNKVIQITCKHGPHTLTIHYMNSEGTTMVVDGKELETVTQKLYARESYSVVSPEVENYAVTHEVVEGTMGYEDVTVNVIYRNQQQAEEAKVKVTVTWGDLNFNYDYGTWNPENHTYEGSTVTPAGDNTVTVVNDGEVSNIYVLTDLVFAPRANTPYPDMSAYFTQDQSGNNRITGVNFDPLAPGKEYKTWIWLEGTMPYDLWGQTLTLGSCQLTIRAGTDYKTP